MADEKKNEADPCGYVDCNEPSVITYTNIDTGDGGDMVDMCAKHSAEWEKRIAASKAKREARR